MGKFPPISENFHNFPSKFWWKIGEISLGNLSPQREIVGYLLSSCFPLTVHRKTSLIVINLQKL